MRLSKQARRDAKALFRSTQMNGVMEPAKVRQVVQLMLEKKPRGYIATLEHFKRLVKLEEDRRSARIESAVPLSGDQQSTVSARLQQMYGGGLNVSFQQNPALVGGLRIRVGSDVFDGSIAARLHQLEESF